MRCGKFGTIKASEKSLKTRLSQNRITLQPWIQVCKTTPGYRKISRYKSEHLRCGTDWKRRFWRPQSFEFWILFNHLKWKNSRHLSRFKVSCSQQCHCGANNHCGRTCPTQYVTVLWPFEEAGYLNSCWHFSSSRFAQTDHLHRANKNLHTNLCDSDHQRRPHWSNQKDLRVGRVSGIHVEIKICTQSWDNRDAHFSAESLQGDAISSLRSPALFIFHAKTLSTRSVANFQHLATRPPAT